MSTSDYKYVHIGNDKIKREMYIDIINCGEKPFGGFWASPNNDALGSISDRTDYILEKKSGKYLRFTDGKGCFFNIKQDTKILNIVSDDDVNLIKSKWRNGRYIDYEKVSENYDALYVSPYSLSYLLELNEFDDWKIRSLLIFNLDCIEEYLPFEFVVEENKGAFITSIGTASKISSLPTNYYYLKHLIYQLFVKKMKRFDKDELDKKDIYSIMADIDNIKFSLIKEFKYLDSDSFGMLESIIVNESIRQQKILRKF